MAADPARPRTPATAPKPTQDEPELPAEAQTIDESPEPFTKETALRIGALPAEPRRRPKTLEEAKVADGYGERADRGIADSNAPVLVDPGLFAIRLAQRFGPDVVTIAGVLADLAACQVRR